MSGESARVELDTAAERRPAELSGESRPAEINGDPRSPVQPDEVSGESQESDQVANVAPDAEETLDPSQPPPIPFASKPRPA